MRAAVPEHAVFGPSPRARVAALLLAAIALFSGEARAADAGAAFARGVVAFRAGQYVEAERALRDVRLRTQDWPLYLHAESAFYAGDLTRAREDFERLARSGRGGGAGRGSEAGMRLAEVAGFRAADCLWAAGAHAEAADRYRRLLGAAHGHPGIGVDVAVPRFRVALDAEERKKPEAAKLFLALYRELPAHPLATEAQRHLGMAAGSPSPTPAEVTSSAADKLRRAETLTRERHWPEALDELAKLPADLPPPLATERDFQIGMTKFQMRRDYDKAAQLLLAAAPSLSGDKAASALFHGTRALSRIDRDDEAIAGYKQVVARFPQSRYAAEAQFLSGWLDYNRGRFRESLPGLRATLDRFGKSAFADDAAWCVAFAHFLLGEMDQAAADLDRYARMPPTGMTADERTARVAYWRARIAAKQNHGDEAKAGYREVNRRWPFTFYGAAARARLAELHEAVAVELPRWNGAGGGGRAGKEKDGKDSGGGFVRTDDPLLLRLDELAAGGLEVEAGWELQREEKELLRRQGTEKGTRLLLSHYPLYQAFHRAYEIAESRHGGALAASPENDADARLWWEAAFPRAYRTWVEKYGPAAGNPDLVLYAIMRKESGYSPWDTSSADARGLLQMIPPTSAKVAAAAALPFEPDQLFEPETNIRLGAAYIGGLSRKFGGQIPVLAGAYNAGPKAMAKWCDQHGTHPADEFVELIAFTQTREYSKRIVGLYARYRHLYGPTPYLLPLTIDPKYSKAGPDY